MSQSTAASPLLDPALRARLGGLRLQARHSAAGRGFGLHASRARGAGLEFAQYRAYEPGDELRLMDWKLYARADRYFVRDAERESPLQLWLLVDLSRSMAQRDRMASGPSRLEVARRIAAALAWLALRQGDACGLIAPGGARLPAASGRRQHERVLHALTGLDADAEALADADARALLAQVPEQALVVVLTDGHDPALLQVATRLAALRRDLRLCALRCADERDFPFTGSPLFRDPESAQRRELDAARARDAYLQRQTQARSELAAQLGAAGVHYVPQDTDADPLDAIRRLAGPPVVQRGGR